MMKKWQKYDNKRFGDFSLSNRGCGVVKKTDDDYFIGNFNSDFKLHGIGIHRMDAKQAILSKYNGGYATFPAAHVFDSGVVIVSLDELSDGSLVCLRIDASTSSFEYFTINNSTIGRKGIGYNGKNNTVNFLEFENNKIKNSKPIERSFIPDRPLFAQAKLSFPSISDFDKFEFRSDDQHSVAENSTSSSDPGIGMIIWDDDNQCVGGWLDNYRDGWQIYEFGQDDYAIFYGHRVDYNGLYIRKFENGIYIKTIDGNGKEANSYLLCYINGALSFSDINDKYLLDREGDGIYFPNMDVVHFKKYQDDDEEHATIVASYFRDGVSKDNPDEVMKTNKEEESISITSTLKLNNISTNMDIFPEDSDEEEESIGVDGTTTTTKPTTPQPDEDNPESKVMNLIGQEEVKKEFARIKAYLQKNAAGDVPTNMLFSGSSGVGKSTVAKLLTEIFFKYGAIDKNRYFEVSARDLISNYDGATGSQIINMYKSNRGGIILIDDARYLGRANNSGIKEAINNLTNIMRDDTRTTFIFADNKFNINDLFNSNLELLQDKIRFKINFKDFSKDELRQIIILHANKKGYSINNDALDLFIEVIFLSKAYGNDINASAALSMLEEIIIAQNVRTTDLEDKVIIIDDVQTYIDENDIAFIDPRTGGQSDARQKLDELIGLEKIKETVDDLIAYFSFNRGKKVDCHMAFFGNPGTGKTEVARILGKLLRQEGILPTSKFVEVTRRDLVAEYVGQSAVRTRDVIDKAMGGVLYIDEAYSLAYGGEKDFGREVIAELLKAMEDRRGEFVVILAGYTNEMLNLFNINPGFYSRIKYTLEFPDYTDEELNSIAHLFVERDGYVVSEENYQILVRLVSKERNYPNFANVRTLREYISKVEIKQASRIRKMKPGEEFNDKELLLEDIIGVFGKEAVDEAINGRTGSKVAKLDPARLRELYKNYPMKKFEEYRSLISEVVLAIRVKTSQGGGESTGFIITNDGYVATCAHCVEGAGEIDLRRRIYHNGKRIDIHYAADIVSIDTKNDVAVIKIRTERDDEEFDYVALAEPDHILPPLSRIFELGYPFGVSRFDEMTINEGKIASYQKGKDGDPDQINLDIDAHGGNSGSLIVDGETSRVIGTLTGAALAPHGQIIEQINFCRPISYIWAMLERDFKKE